MCTNIQLTGFYECNIGLAWVMQGIANTWSMLKISALD